MKCQKNLETNAFDFDQQWLLVNAIRQAFGIGRKQTISYADAVALTRFLAPKLVNVDSPLIQAFVSETLRLYSQRAEAQSRIEQRPVKPIEVLDLDTQQLRLEAQQAAPDQSQAIETQISKLERARDSLTETRWTESRAIDRDANAPEKDLPISNKGQGYKEYWLSKDRRLRVRVLHPDLPEARSGVDLIYETYYDKVIEGQNTTLLVRIAALQYKMWNGKELYASQASNLLSQMEKMRQVFCEAGFCEHPSTPGGDERYRLPHCCAFLRPTDRNQTSNAWKVTHAWQVPVCVALEKFELTSKGNKVLRSKTISCNSTTQDTFQELYNRSMLGSRWLKSTKLQQLYEQLGIFDNLNRVIVHAQEY
jgi:hypothetical protein